jgi:asparagine synthase (glutamine-hydrolysing)
VCGLIGIVGIPDFRMDMRGLLGRIAHRGPDAAGIFETDDDQHLKMGHRRLSIIDLSDAANQPFHKGDLVVVFNGEIYNYQTLRAEIEASGVRFRTNSDTEVVLEAWRAWGPQCFVRMRGMFAIAIYDKREGRLILARDPFGIKPLFLFQRGRELAFASELKALLPILGSDAEVDDTGVVAALIDGWLPDEFCMYRNVRKLLPGHWLERRNDGTLTQHVYWDPVTEMAEQEARPFDVDRLREVLRDSVSAHMVADVPVATFLSGGLDSSLITVLARKQVGQMDCFTIAFRPEDQKFEAMPDDLLFARRLAKLADLRLHEILIRPDIAQMLPQMVDTLDEPIGDAAAINAYLICKAAREVGIKVLLSGMGADEIFAGYRRQFACLAAARYRMVPQFVRKVLIEPAVRMLPAASRNRGYRTFRWAKRFIQFAGMNEEEAFHRSYALLGRSDLQQVLNRELTREVDEVFSRHAEIYAHGSSQDPINRMCHADVRLFLSGLNLAYTDRASMAASTEVRVPFVDTEVVRAAFRLRGTDKLRGRQSKWALKKAAEAWLPRSIIYRPKGLFSAPLRAWIRKDLRTMVDDILPNGELIRRGYVKRDYITNLIKDDRAGRADFSKEIWHLLTMDQWFRRHRETTSVANPSLIQMTANAELSKSA